MSTWNCQKTRKSIFLYWSLPKLPSPLPLPKGGDLGAVLRTAAAKGYRLLKLDLRSQKTNHFNSMS